MEAKKSAVAKSRGAQDQHDMSTADKTFLKVLYQKKKISKYDADYAADQDRRTRACVKCKFNLGDEGKCHIVRGRVDNERGASRFFSPKGDGMLPGDIVWEYVKQSGVKLRYKEGYVIEKGAAGFQCKDCKYFLYSKNCLLIKGRFKPKMSCGFIVKTGHGTDI